MCHEVTDDVENGVHFTQPLTIVYGGASPKGEAFYILAKIQLL
jgi:hypothetical protein